MSSTAARELVYSTAQNRAKSLIVLKYEGDIVFSTKAQAVETKGGTFTWTTTPNLKMVIKNDGKVGIGTATPSYPLEIVGNVSDISLYVSKNISAEGYITRTSVFDKSKSVWDYIKDASYYIVSGKIDHSKFYGYVTYKNKDTSRPVEETHIEKQCEIIEDGKVCKDVTITTVTYPYQIDEEGVELGMEIDVLRQAVYELSQELCSKDNSYSFC